MKKLNTILWMVLLLAMSACQQDVEMQTPEESQELETGQQAAVLKGRIRVKFKAEAESALNVVTTKSGTSSGISAVDLAGVDLSVYRMERVFPYAGKFEERHRRYGLHLWYDVYFDEKIPTRSAVDSYRQLAEVESAGSIPEISLCDYEKVPEILDPVASLLTAQTTDATEEMPFNDPNLPNMWHYHNAGESVNHLSGALEGSDIGVFEAWKTETGSREVIVAVMDGGIQYDHPDLRDNMWINEAELNGLPGVDDDNNGYVDDIYGYNFVTAKRSTDEFGRTIYTNGDVTAHDHGTHCAGTISGVNNNNIGISGIAGGSGNQDGVRLMSCQIFHMNSEGKQLGTTDPNMFVYAADMGAVISSNSWKMGGTEQDFMNSGLATAIDYFRENAGKDLRGNQDGPMAGGLVVFSAANDNTEVEIWPSAYEPLFTVAAVGHNFKRAPYSNFGKWVDITATGGDQGYGTQYGILSTVTGGRYEYYQGTSMACPHVAGCAALVLSKFQGPGYLPAELEDRLLNSTKDIDGYNKNYVGLLGSGLIDVGKALTPPSTEAPEVSTLHLVDAYDGWAIVEWEVKAAPDGPMSKYVISWSDQPLAETTDVMATAENVWTKTVNVRKVAAGTVVRDTVRGLKVGQTYYFSLKAYDRWGGVSEAAPQVEKEVKENLPPVVEPQWQGAIILEEGSVRGLSVKVTEPEGQKITCRLSRELPWMKMNIGEEVTLEIAPGYRDSGNYRDTLLVSDVYGKTVRVPFVVEVQYKEVSPVMTGRFADLTLSAGSGLRHFDLTGYFEDPKGRSLVYEVESSDASIVVVKRQGNDLSIEPKAVGRTTILVRAVSEKGYSVSQRFVVKVTPGIAGDTEMTAYPNPVVKELTIRLPEAVQGNVVVRLYNMAGRMLVAKNVTIDHSGYVLDMSGMQAGTYLLSVEGGAGSWKKNIIKL